MDLFVKLDKSGRFVLPKSVRDIVRANEFRILVGEDGKLVFIPVKSTGEMFGSMPNLNLKGFEREHDKER